MGIKTFRPLTPSRRHMMSNDFAEISDKRKRPEKGLLEPLPQKGGRNHHGSITVRFQGGRHKRRYRRIDFRRDKVNVPAKVVSIEYDPNRSARIALLQYKDGEKRYILAPVGLEVGATVVSADNADIQPGNSLPLGKMPTGINVHNIELKPGKGGQMARTAGVFAQVMAREGGYVLLRLPSGELRQVHENCRATVGQVGNVDHENIFIGKAGRARWLGHLPHNRGVTMNPVDHPLGGGEGKAKGGRHPVTPWGKPTKGYKTRNNKKSDRFITQRRPKGKQA